MGLNFLQRLFFKEVPEKPAPKQNVVIPSRQSVPAPTLRPGATLNKSPQPSASNLVTSKPRRAFGNDLRKKYRYRGRNYSYNAAGSLIDDLGDLITDLVLLDDIFGNGQMYYDDGIDPNVIQQDQPVYQDQPVQQPDPVENIIEQAYTTAPTETYTYTAPEPEAEIYSAPEPSYSYNSNSNSNDNNDDDSDDSDDSDD